MECVIEKRKSQNSNLQFHVFDISKRIGQSQRALISPVGLFLFRMSRIIRKSALYRHWYRWRCWQMGATRQEAVLISRVSDQNRRAVRCRVTVLTSDRLNLIRPDILRLPRLRYGDSVFRIVAATHHLVIFFEETGKEHIRLNEMQI